MNIKASVLYLALAAQPANAHHSYAMFDGTRTLKVSGTIAKLEWRNPHTYVWLYVRNDSSASGFDLYAFESAGPGVLSDRGWSKTSFVAGEKVTIEYWPLKDGRTGGHFVSATYADGRVLRGAGGPRGVEGNLAPPKVPVSK